MAGHGRKHPPIPVIVVLVLALAGGGSLNGQVEARQYDISSAIAGRVLTVPVAEGDQVTKGQPIVTLDTAALDLQLKQAQQGVIAAQAAVTNAKDSGTKADVPRRGSSRPMPPSPSRRCNSATPR